MNLKETRMIHGSRLRFAIECELDQPMPGYLFGHICMWAGGERIGDFTQTVLLAAPAVFLRDFLRYTGQRQEDMLEKATPEEALQIVFAALYEDNSSTLHDLRQLANRYYKFCVCPGGGEAFDGEFAILVECRDHARFIWRDCETRSLHEIYLTPGEFETVAESSLAWILNKK